PGGGGPPGPRGSGRVRGRRSPSLPRADRGGGIRRHLPAGRALAGRDPRPAGNGAPRGRGGDRPGGPATLVRPGGRHPQGDPVRRHLILEAAGDEDVEALVELEERCHSHPWRAASFREEMGDPARGAVVVLRAPFEPAERGRGIVGYYAYQVAADEMHILNLAVAPEHRRGGLGGFLL